MDGEGEELRELLIKDYWMVASNRESRKNVLQLIQGYSTKDDEICQTTMEE